MIVETVFGYIAYEVVIVLPQVTKHWYRYNQRYKAFLEGGFTGAFLHEKKKPNIYQDPYIPPTIVFKEYRIQYLRRVEHGYAKTFVEKVKR